MKVFTVSPGRTGTAYLAECFRGNAPSCWQVEHEGPFLGGFGSFRPDISHLHAYNCNERKEYLWEYWKRKFAELPEYYVETSHINCKAGLIEHLDLLNGPVIVVHLRRNIRDVFLSIAVRGGMLTKSDMWMWHLDPEYPANLVDKNIFADDMLGNIAWYLLEMETRARRLKDLCRSDWLTVSLEDIAEPEGLAEMLKHFGIDHKRTPPKVNANPHLDFELGFLSAADIVISELEDRIRAL